MVNTSFAKVAITADKVGREVEAYLAATQGWEYDLLHRWESQENEDERTFRGRAFGRYQYAHNVNGYLKDDARRWTVGESGCDESFDALMQAVQERRGFVRLEWVDSECERELLVSGEALLRYDEPAQGVLFSGAETTFAWDYTVSNLARALELSACEAITEFGYSELAAEFEQQCDLDGIEAPSAETAEAWLNLRLPEWMEE